MFLHHHDQDVGDNVVPRASQRRQHHPLFLGPVLRVRVRVVRVRVRVVRVRVVRVQVVRSLNTEQMLQARCSPSPKRKRQARGHCLHTASGK